MKARIVKALAKRASKRLKKMDKMDIGSSSDPYRRRKEHMVAERVYKKLVKREGAVKKLQEPAKDVVGARQQKRAQDKIRKQRAKLKSKNRARVEAQADHDRWVSRHTKTPQQYKKKYKKIMREKRRAVNEEPRRHYNWAKAKHAEAKFKNINYKRLEKGDNYVYIPSKPQPHRRGQRLDAAKNRKKYGQMMRRIKKSYK